MMRKYVITAKVKDIGFYINEYKEVLPYINIFPEFLNNKLIQTIYLRSWGEADALRLIPSALLIISLTDTNELFIDSTATRDISYKYPRPKICPLCREYSLNVPFRGWFGYDHVQCTNKDCIHNNIITFWKIIKYTFQIPYLSYYDIYKLYTENSMRTLKGVFFLNTDKYQNLGYTLEEALEICDFIDGIKKVNIANFIYSVLPRTIDKQIVYNLAKLYNEKTFGAISVEKNNLTSDMKQAIRIFNEFFTTPLGKEFKKLKLELVYPNKKNENIKFKIHTPDLRAWEYLDTLISFSMDFTNTTDEAIVYDIVSSRDPLDRKNRLTIQDFVTKFNIPLPKDIISAIEDNPIVLEK